MMRIGKDDKNQRKRNSSSRKTKKQETGSNRSLLKGSNHSKGNLGKSKSSRHMKGSSHRNSSGSLHRTSQYENDSDNESFISSCSFGSDYHTKQKSTSSLPVAPPPPTAMFSNQAFKLIYLSWDVIKNMEEGKKRIGEKLFELLSDDDVPLSRWLTNVGAAHQTSFVDMIDMIVSMLSPTDLDVVSEELVSLGQRHAQYNKELIQAFLPSLFQHLTDAFCTALKHCVYRHLFGGGPPGEGGRENLMIRSSSLHSLFDDSVDALEGKRPSNWKMVEHAWQDLFWYMRCQMEKGAMMEYQHQKYQQPPCTEIEYDVELKSDAGDNEDEEVSLKGSKPWSFSSRKSSSASSTVSNSESSNTQGSSTDTGTTNSRKKRSRRRGLPKSLRLLRLNSFSASIRSSSFEESESSFTSAQSS